MGVDSRGKERGECGECDCSDFEAPVRGSKCGYCDCAPPKHRLISNSSTRQPTNRQPTNRQPTNTQPTDRQPWQPYADVTDLGLPLAGTFRHDTMGDDWAHVENITSTPLNSKPPTKPFIAVADLDTNADLNTRVTAFDLPDITAGKASQQAELPPWPSSSTKKPDKQRAREVARQGAPSRRKNVTDKNTTPSKPTPGARSGKRKKSLAVKCHNLDEIMSSHLSDQRTAEKIDKMFSNFDDDGSNELDRDECTQLTGYILEQCGLQPDIIPAFVFDEAFDKYDDDGGGTITMLEFREFLMSHLKK